MYAELHCHTEQSNHRVPDCIIKVKDLIQTAFDMGLKAVSLTDHECLSGHIKAIQINKKLKETNPDFKVILGNEIYLIKSLDKEEKKKYYHFILLAKDKLGHRYLRELSSRAWKQSFYDRRLERTPTLYSDVEEVVKEKGHLIGSSACLGGYFPTLVLNYLNTNENQYKYQIDDFINWCINIFGQDDFYIELQPGLTTEQIEFNKKAIQIAKFYELKWIVTNDVHYLKKEDRTIHQAYLNSKDEERESGDFYESCYFKTEEEIKERLQYLDEKDVQLAIDNTIDIYNKIEFFDLKQDVIVPELELDNFNLQHIFKSWYDKYENIKYFSESNFVQDQFLLHQIEQGFIDLEEEYNEENLSRMNIELEQLKEISEKLNQRLSSYYTLTQKIIEIMWSDELGNSIVPPGRGSTCGWYISYLLKISQIKPMKYNLPWWRHVHKSKVELSDIDIDSEQSKRQGIFEALKRYFGENKVLNICTFKTEGTKSATLTSCRGLGIDVDIAQEIADMIPTERGKLWTISECIYGSEEKNRQPIKQLKEKLEQYPLLLETIFKIEGLICGRSIHASGVFVFANEYLDQNSLMKAPNGKLITAFEMNDSETMGCLKIDCLTIAGADKIRKTLELLLKEKIITWQGTLRKTYDKYLHPNIIEYQNSAIWDLLCNGEIIDLFQFDSLVGKQAITKVQPRTLKEMMSANALMRLQAEDNAENPIDRYVRFKNDNTQWDLEMIERGLNQHEILILKKYLSSSYGVCGEQEDLIELAMAEEVANFSFPEANDFKSGVAKKKEEKIQKAKKLFYQKGVENNCRKVFLDYVWNYCFKPQFGYSFSRNHDCPYSVIALQEMNLVYKYGQLFWNTACLTVNSSADEDNEDNKTTNYGKISKAISAMQSNGVKILLPNINKADFGFTPDLDSNSILFGLKGISNVGDEVAFNIIAKRSYDNLIDFIEKTNTTKTSTINLIKGGAFDTLENKERIQIMKDYLSYLAQKEYEPKTKLTLSYLDKINELGLLNKDNDIYLRYYNFNKYVMNKEFFKEKIKNKSYYIAKDKAFNFFQEHYLPKLREEIDYWLTEEGIVFCKSSYDKIYKKQMEWIINYINLPDIINTFNQKNCDNYINENWNKYCQGNISSWEMDSLSFYYHEHELSNINKTKYNLTDFNEIPEQPIVEGSYKKKGREYPKYRLYKIIGTVLDRDKTKHIVTLLTPDGVVDIKFYEGSFNWYNKQISKVENDVKTVIEKSWFVRGTKLMICGIRRDQKFFPKKYFDSIYNHTVCLIEDIQGDELILKLERDTV
jgi:DNA polymerase-3 subunit alpha